MKRKDDLFKAVVTNKIEQIYAIEDDSALEFIDGKLIKSISSGGKSYKITNNGGILQQELI